MSSRLATPQSVARSVAGSVVSSSRASSSIYSSLTGSWLILIDRSCIRQELILSCRSHLKCRKVFDMERYEVVGEWFRTPNAASKREKGLYSKFQRMQVEGNVPSSFETFKKVAFFNPFMGFTSPSGCKKT